MQTPFEKLIGTRRREFTITLDTDDGPVELTFNHPKKSLQAIMLDCKAGDDAIKFMLAAANGFADAEPPKNGEDIDIVLRSAGVHCLLNELVHMKTDGSEEQELTKPQCQELLNDMAPHLLQQLSDKVQAAITKDLADAAKN